MAEKRPEPSGASAAIGEESKIWVSAFNARAEARPVARGSAPVRFYDTTLRDGEQTVGVTFDPEQKLEIARRLDALGVDRIEAGFPRVSAEDAEAFERICKAGLRAEVWGFARAVPADLDEVIRRGGRACLVEISTSDIKHRAYGITRGEALRRIGEAVRHAKQHGLRVAFFPVDATRTELDQLREAYAAALDAGADELVVVDTIGACGPEAVEFLVGAVREWVGERVPLHFHGHNDFGLATACAIAAVHAGAGWIHGTINGMGERAGNADLGEIAMALRCLYGVPTALDLGQIREVSEYVRRAAGYELDPWKPVVGQTLFVRESGAVASQFHIPEAIEPFSAELVHAKRAIVLGKKSGLDSITLKCRELGLTLPDDRRAEALAAVKRKGIEKRGLVSDAEFREIVRAVCPE
jgi:isopropylmalate/homocitrate/citramalate synthase